MKTITLATLTLVLLACGGNEPTSAKIQKVMKETPAENASETSKELPNQSMEEEKGIQDFNAFYSQFRTAAIKKDWSTLKTLTQFPFETRGELDGDPIIKYNEAQFSKAMDVFMNQYAGLDMEGSSELNILEKTKTVPKSDQQADYVRVSNLEFRKTKTGWKFAFAYFVEDTYTALKKK